MGEFVTIKEYAAKYSVTEEAVRKRCQRGSIPAEKRGRDWFINDEAEYPKNPGSETKGINDIGKQYFRLMDILETEGAKLNLENDEQFCIACGIVTFRLAHRGTNKSENGHRFAHISRSKTLGDLKRETVTLITENLEYVTDLIQDYKNLYAMICLYNPDLDKKIDDRFKDLFNLGAMYPYKEIRQFKYCK